ncbi:MAG: VWA domain-containing protein [Acidobacteriota bacterium]|nr:VWA domain-containing protein [Acidobacteriota bacterium]
MPSGSSKPKWNVDLIHRGKLRFALVSCSVAIACCAHLAAQQTSASPEPTFKIEVNRLLVPVVVRDAQGRAVGDLQQGDFQVLDNGKNRPISGFLVQQRGAAVATATSGERLTATSAASRTVPGLPERITVFLFDDIHMSAEDLAHAQEAAVKGMAGAVSGTDMAAAVSTSGRANSGLTRDRAKLQEVMMSLQPLGVFRAESLDCPDISYYEAVLIEDKHDSIAIQDANQKYFNCHPAMTTPQDASPGNELPTAENMVDLVARRALTLGHQDVQTTYASIAAYVRRLAPMPGQRTLILVSPGFLTIEPGLMTAESRLIDLAAQSGVVISAIDARGLYTTQFNAGDRSPALARRSLQLNSEYHGNAKNLAENSMAELADGTGGTYFHNSNDLTSGIKELTQAPQYVYLLELSLDNVKPNGSYHRLKVKVNRTGLQLQARRGYFISRPDKHRK